LSRAVVLCALAGACGHVHFTASPDTPTTSDWWNTRWPYRQPIVFDHAQVAADQTDFPVLVTSPSDPGLAAHAQNRIAFTDANNVVLAFELESLEPALVAWVNVPTLSATTDTTLYLYYGDATAPDQSQPANVWTNGFTGVYHFGDGTTLDVADSTGMNDASSQGATAGAGQIRGAASFDGTADVAAPTTGLDTSAGAVDTVTFWLYFDGPFDAGPLAFVATTGAVYDLWFEIDGCEGFNTGAGEVLGTTASGLANRWLYVAAEFYNGLPQAATGTQPGNALYLDGAAQSLSFTCGPGTPNPVSVFATLDWGGNPGYHIHGRIDEGRFAVGARSATWIATEYANQSSPATFETFGPEQAQ